MTFRTRHILGLALLANVSLAACTVVGESVSGRLAA